MPKLPGGSKHARVLRGKCFKRDMGAYDGRYGNTNDPQGKGRVRWIRCNQCKEFVKVTRATLQHIIPICRGGIHHLDNLVLFCDRCNQEESKRYNQNGESN